MYSDQWDAIKCGALAEAAVLMASVKVGGIGAGAVCRVVGSTASATQAAILALLAKAGSTMTAEQLAGLQILIAAALGYVCPLTGTAIYSKLATFVPQTPYMDWIRQGAQACLNVGGTILSTVYECAKCAINDPIDDTNTGDTPGVKQGRLCRDSSGTFNPFGSRRENCRGCCFDKVVAGTITRDQLPACQAACHED